MRSLLNAALASALLAIAGASKPLEQGGDEPKYPTVTRKDNENTSAFFAHNPFDYPVTVSVNLPTLENARAAKPLPVVVTLPPRKQNVMVVSAKRIDAKKSFRVMSDTKWAPGSADARHDDEQVYQLPYPAGHAFQLWQGHDGTFSHKGKYAFDWTMPEGSTVCAARDGVVVRVVEKFSEGGPDLRFQSTVNVVYLRHDDGTIGGYFHLAKDGADVEVGQRVPAGEPIGRSGNTGYSGGPHLHFEVMTAAPDASPMTLPIKFATTAPEATDLREKEYYQRPFEDQEPGEDRLPANLVEKAFLALANDGTDNSELEPVSVFKATDRMLVLILLRVPGYKPRVEIKRAGATETLYAYTIEARATSRKVGVNVVFSAQQALRGDLIAQILINDELVAELPFQVQ